MNPEQHMLNGKRRNADSPGGEEQVEDDKGIIKIIPSFFAIEDLSWFWLENPPCTHDFHVFLISTEQPIV